MIIDVSPVANPTPSPIDPLIEAYKLGLVPAGPSGGAATVQVGTVTTLAPGEPATVDNVGTESNVVLNFGIPRGEDGETGLDPAQNLADVEDPEAALANIGGAPSAQTYTKLEVDGALTGKADASDVYSKSSIDDKFAGQAVTISEDLVAEAGHKLIVDTSTSAITIDLPAAPSDGNIVIVWRDGGHPVTVDPGDEAIRHVSGSLVLDVDGQGVRLTFIAGEWIAFPEALP